MLFSLLILYQFKALERCRPSVLGAEGPSMTSSSLGKYDIYNMTSTAGFITKSSLKNLSNIIFLCRVSPDLSWHAACLKVHTIKLLELKVKINFSPPQLKLVGFHDSWRYQSGFGLSMLRGLINGTAHRPTHPWHPIKCPLRLV